MTTREYHIGDILSVISGVLVSPRHVGGVVDLLQWMTGDTLWTHQIPRVCEECEPALRQQFPDLAAIQVPGGMASKEEVLAWLAKVEQEYGCTRQVAPMPPGEHTSIDPLTEFAQQHPDVSVVPIVVDTDEGSGS